MTEVMLKMKPELSAKDVIGAVTQVGSECELNSWLIVHSVRVFERNLVVVGLKSPQANFLYLKKNSVVNSICVSLLCYTHVITCASFRLKYLW